MKTKGKSLCFVGNMLGRNPGYVTTQGLIVADLLAAENHEVICISSKINRAARLREIVQTLIRKHRQIKIVILEVYSGLSFFIADAVSLLCKIYKIPLVMVLHGGNLPEFAARQPLRTKAALKRASFLVAPSKFMAEKIAEHGFDVRIISNVIDIEKYPCRERAAISPNFIWMRSFHPIYNPQMAIRVFAEVRKSFPNAALTMAGADKGSESDTKRLAADLGVSQAVKFTGFLDEEKKICELSKADIYLHTNRLDNMPVSVIEACALGLPVVAAKVGGIPYLLQNGENALLIESENVGEMVKAVKDLLRNPELTGKISRNARMLAERSAWMTVKNEWESLFREISNRQTF